MTIIVKQVYWYISQISGERLQDHWSCSLPVRAKTGIALLPCIFKLAVVDRTSVINHFDRKKDETQHELNSGFLFA